MSAAPKPLRLFIVRIRRPDGSETAHPVAGGHSVDHAVRAMDEAGPGGSVRVSHIKPPIGATA